MAHFEVPVSEYMTRSVRGVGPQQSLSDADLILHTEGMSALAVLDDSGALVGVLSRKDLLAEGTYGHDRVLTLPDKTVGETMSRPAITVGSDEPLSRAAKTMLNERIHRVFVTSGGELVGVLSTRDLMRAVHDKGIRLPLSEIATRSLVTVNAKDPLALVLDRLEQAHKQALVVLDGEWPVGIVDERAALAARGLPPETPADEVMNLAVLVLPEQMPLARAAEQALAMRVRRILTRNERDLVGIVSGLDFARVVA